MRKLSLMLALAAGLASTVMVPDNIVPDAAADGRWGSAARLDAPRAGLAMTVLDGRLYAAGGAGVTSPRVEFESYDAEIDRWFPETPLPRGLERFGMAAVGGRIYVAGGYAVGGSVRGDSWSGDRWSDGEAIGEQRVAPSARMWSWSIEGGVWQSEAAMPAAKADFDLVALDGKLYAIGGQRDAGEVFVFDPQARHWDVLETPDGVTRSAAATVAFDGRVYVSGGFEDLHTSWAPGEAGWREEAALPSPRTNAAAAALQGALYLVGGGSGGGFFSPFTAVDNTDIFREEAS